MSFIYYNPNPERKLVGDCVIRAIKERMIGKLEDMMDSVSMERERRILQQCVDKLEQQ